ncbi:hypothetical protein ACEUZ9_005361 [Paracoccus litorisediminis]|uniref:T4SS efffector SepA family protein n=1 Tax=Paracoccus litorisediminis TaxID=2006130 RepID=UPI003732B50B
MPVVRLNDAAFIDLKSISTWMGTETPSETIVQLVREKMAALDLERDIEADLDEAPSVGSFMEFKAAPGLSFTKVLSAEVDRKSIEKPNWAAVLIATIEALRAKGLSEQRLGDAIQVPVKSAPYEEEGFRYYPALGISIQGQSAQEAWKEISRIADKHAILVQVTFQWRDNDKAQHPGQKGILRSGRTSHRPLT